MRSRSSASALPATGHSRNVRTLLPIATPNERGSLAHGTPPLAYPYRRALTAPPPSELTHPTNVHPMMFMPASPATCVPAIAYEAVPTTPITGRIHLPRELLMPAGSSIAARKASRSISLSAFCLENLRNLDL
eukprot:1463314-Rhodomonas_salina.1